MGLRSQHVLRAFATVGALLLFIPSAQAGGPDAVPLPTTAVLASPATIQRLAYDPWEGGVWIGTEGGLFFKDLDTGALRHYGIGQGMPHFLVHDVALDADQVWVGTGWGVAVLDRATQKMDLVHKTDGTVLRITCRTLFADADAVWLGTDEGGLFRIDRSTLVATSVPNPINGTRFAHAIYGLGAVGDELYVSAARYGLVRWDRATDESWLYDTAYLQDEPYYGRIDVSAKEVWIGSGGEGTLRLDRTSWQMDQYASPNSVNAHAVYRPVKAFGLVWFPTYSGASVHDPVAKTWRYWSDFPGGRNLNEIVLADGELYGATDLAFIVRYDRVAQEWRYVAWWTDAQTMDYNLVQSCERTPEGPLLFGTGGGGAHLFEPRTGWRVYGGVPGAPQPADINIMSTASDARARFFTHYHGVSELDLASGDYLHYYVDGRGAGDLRWGANVARDVELDETTAWFASATTREKQLRPTDPVVWHPGKVTRLDRATHAMTYYGIAEGLSDGNLTTLALDGTTLWIGTERHGLDALDTQTGEVRHVYPSSGALKVTDILVDGGRLWLATTQQGVLRLDPQTGQAEAVAGTGGLAAALDLHAVDGTIWVGTYYGGLLEVDPQAMQATHHGAPGPLDRVIYCLADRDGILYAGTGWGVERFDLARKVFLHQMSPLAASSADGPLPEAALDIATPAQGASFGAGTRDIEVTGTATAPAGSQVRVRLGDGPWTAAEGLAAWSAVVDARAAPSAVRVAVRLEQDGLLLAQAFADITIGGGVEAGPAPGPTTFTHMPVLQAWVDEPWHVAVGGVPEGATATATVQPAEGQAITVPLATAGDGVLSAAMPAFRVAGVASYRIDLVVGGSHVRLPEASEGYGDAYPMVVRDLADGARPRLVDPGTAQVQAGKPTELQVVIQNPSGRDQVLRVRLDAPAGVTGPEGLVVPAGGSATLTLQVAIAGSHAAARERIGIELLAADGEDALASLGFDLVIADAAGALPPEAQDAPLPVWVAVLALAITVLRRRRA